RKHSLAKRDVRATSLLRNHRAFYIYRDYFAGPRTNARRRARVAGGVAATRASAAWIATPLSGARASLLRAASARNSGSASVASKAARSAATRSAGTSGPTA